LLIKSPAGEFPITIERFEIEGSELVIVGKMGVWDARTHVEPRDFLQILGKLFLSPRRRQNNQHDHRGFAHHYHRIQTSHLLASWPLIQPEFCQFDSGFKRSHQQRE
jgi:hypothetical protein